MGTKKRKKRRISGQLATFITLTGIYLPFIVIVILRILQPFENPNIQEEGNWVQKGESSNSILFENAHHQKYVVKRTCETFYTYGNNFFYKVENVKGGKRDKVQRFNEVINEFGPPGKKLPEKDKYDEGFFEICWNLLTIPWQPK